eukprot:scaffold124905_cov20-Tisochrysis_lutea.AAC.2
MFGEFQLEARFTHSCCVHTNGDICCRLKRMLGHMELNCATNHMSRLGTIDYLAPEILDCPVKQNPQDNKHDPSIGGKQNQRHWAYFTKRILAPGCRCIFTGSL